MRSLEPLERLAEQLRRLLRRRLVFLDVPAADAGVAVAQHFFQRSWLVHRGGGHGKSSEGAGGRTRRPPPGVVQRFGLAAADGFAEAKQSFLAGAAMQT